MRKWIDIVEQIVHKDRFLQPHCDKKTVVAINPSRQEWEANFPKGAAGVFLKDGRIVVGDGNCLDHASIMDYANIPYSMELCRLQIHANKGAYAELWIDEEMADEEDHTVVINRVEASIGMTLSELEEMLKSALGRFMGDIPVKAIPFNTFDQEPLMPAHADFRNNLWTS